MKNSDQKITELVLKLKKEGEEKTIFINNLLKKIDPLELEKYVKKNYN